MKIFLNIEADSPAELDAAIAGLANKIGAVTQVAASIVDQPAAEAPVAAEKKTRAKKAETPAPAKEPEKAPEAAAAPAKDLTADEVKNYVIDYLNDVTAAEPNDSEARVKALHKVIKHITGGDLMKLTELISGNQDRWQDIIAFVDERRVELKAQTAENVEE